MADELDAEDVPKREISGKKIVLFVVLPLLLVLLLAALAYLLRDLLFSKPEPEQEEEEEEVVEAVEPAFIPEGPGFFLELGQMTVNLQTTGRRTSWLRLTVTLELIGEADLPAVEMQMPRIIDDLQIYLRELRAEDLRGASGLFRLREELLRRINNLTQPVRIKDVLFKEMIVQ